MNIVVDRIEDDIAVVEVSQGDEIWYLDIPVKELGYPKESDVVLPSIFIAAIVSLTENQPELVAITLARAFGS